MADLAAALDLGSAALWALVGLSLLAGMVRGFAGFGLSAIVMALAVLFLAPIELVPMLWWMEMSASLLLMKGGWADADRNTALMLTLSAGVGLPVGLLLTMAIPVATSKLVALILLIALATAQLSRLTIPGLASRPGTLATGFTAGTITGLAGAGGMFAALYTLARDLPARVMRGTMNIYLLGGGALGLVTHIALGTMTAEATTRGLILIVPTLAGVFLGRALFTPRWEGYYKPICLALVIALAAAGLIRLGLGGTT